MQQVRAVALTGFFEVASFMGLDGHRLMREAGITPEMLADPENRLKAASAINVVEKAAEASGCDSFGLLMVASRTFASLGPIALLLQHLDTVGDVVAAMTKYHRHLADIMICNLECTENVAVIKIGLTELGKRQSLDIAMGAAYLALAGASGGRWIPECVHFVHEQPANLSHWQRMFRAPLEFGSSFNGFSCTAGSLAIGTPLANPEMARHAERLLELMHLPPVDELIAERVRRTILLLLPGGRITLQQVGKNMGLSGRTLQRNLEAEGQTFGQLLNDVRREVVLRSLSGSNQTMSAIAEMTGYNSVGSFSRWFSSEFGMAPTDWRAAQRKIADGPPPFWRV